MHQPHWPHKPKIASLTLVSASINLSRVSNPFFCSVEFKLVLLTVKASVMIWCASLMVKPATYNRKSLGSIPRHTTINIRMWPSLVGHLICQNDRIKMSMNVKFQVSFKAVGSVSLSFGTRVQGAVRSNRTIRTNKDTYSNLLDIFA